MTSKQIAAAKKALYKKPKQEWSKADKILYEELTCREMINSILIYGGTCEKDTYQYQRYIKPYIVGNTWHKTLLSEERVDELIAEQKAEIAKAEIGFAGYDDEGCSYRYCKFADD